MGRAALSGGMSCSATSIACSRDCRTEALPPCIASTAPICTQTGDASMLTRRETMKTLFALAAAAAVESSGGAGARAATPLSWKHFPADERGFLRAPVLLTDDKEAILIDGGFTLSDGRALAEAIKSSGKTLTTVYVSQSD